MKTVLILGASGMVGGEVLSLCLQNHQVGKVKIIVRRPLGIINDKLEEIIHSDYYNYSTIADRLKDVDVCYFCIGVYTGAVPKEEFNKITIDMPFELAKVLNKQNPNITFCLLSGAGADSTEQSRVLFAKAKGIAENRLIGLGFNRLYIFRPGYIYPVTPRKEPNIWYRLFRILYKPLKGIMKSSSVTSVQLASKMIAVSLSENEQVIFENMDIIKSS
ncbi:hypothetical protein [Seonamhaeicola sp.]|uniref:hypothetical protein n=1 Tax=Seonamhaeicola sp. TaxID=1912245 RepID=UPI00263810B5|nr:hypothetical protein [Seonamhaeicola sp.]